MALTSVSVFALLLVACVDGALFVGICGNANPNSMRFEYCQFDSETGTTKNLTIYENNEIAGALSNDFAVYQDKAFFVSINITSLTNYIYTVDSTSGEILGARVPLPPHHVLGSIEADPSDGSLWGMQIEDQYMYFVRIDGSTVDNVLNLGTDILQNPGLSGFSASKSAYLAVCQTSQGATLFSISTNPLHSVTKTQLRDVDVNAISSVAWDDANSYLYVMLSPYKNPNATLIGVDVANGGHQTTVANIPTYPTGTGAVGFVDGTYFAVHSNMKGDEYVLLAVNVATGEYNTTLLSNYDLPISMQYISN